MKKEDNVQHLPELMQFFRFTLFAGILWTAVDTFKTIRLLEGFINRIGMAGTVFLLVSDAAHIALLVWCIVELSRLSRKFMIPYYVSAVLMASTIIYLYSVGLYTQSSITSLVIVCLWSLYFFKSKSFAAIFPKPGKAENPEPMVQEQPKQEQTGIQQEEAKQESPIADPICAERMIQPENPEQQENPHLTEDPKSEEAPPEKTEEPHTEEARPEETVPVKFKTEKKRFCKYCGTEIWPQDVKCPKCGKRARLFRTGKTMLVAISILLILSLAGNAVLSFITFNENKSVQYYKEKSEKLASLSFEDWQKTGIYKSYYMFLRYHVAIVTPYGKTYHLPGCSYLENAEHLNIYSVSGAESLGYTPCSVCHAKSFREAKMSFAELNKFCEVQ